MSSPSYQVHVYEPITGTLRYVFDPAIFYNMRYSRVLNDVGAIAITFSDDDVTLLNEIFTLDSLIEVYRSDNNGNLQREETFLTRINHRYRDEDGSGGQVVIGGVSLNHLIARRVIDPADDPLQAGGYSTKAGPADTVLRSYALEQMADNASLPRRFLNLTVPPVLGVGRPVGARKRYDNLLVTFQELAELGRIDFYIAHVGSGALQLQLTRIGSDKTRSANYPTAPWVGLDPERGNLLAPEFRDDRKEEQNYVYALGEGQGTNRTVLQVQGTTAGDSPYNRIEFVADLRTAAKGSSLQLLTGALEALIENEPVEEFRFTVSATSGGSIYRDDWDIGDNVTAIWGDVMRDLRITGVEIDVSDAGEVISVTVKQDGRQ